jgi:hypothetical protein
MCTAMPYAFGAGQPPLPRRVRRKGQALLASTRVYGLPAGIVTISGPSGSVLGGVGGARRDSKLAMNVPISQHATWRLHDDQS